MTIPALLATTLIALMAQSSKGSLALRVDGLRPVRLTVSVPLPAPLPLGDQSEMLSGLSNADREKLRTRLAQLVREELEKAGFQVLDPTAEGVPLFIVFAEAQMVESDRGPVAVQTSVEMDEPAVWVRDPTKKGFIVVWKRSSTARVSRKDVAKSIERGVLEGLKAFTSAQTPGESKQE